MSNNWSETRKESLHLKIANSRGRKPVMRDLEKARKLINSLMVEINPCDAKNILKDIENKLWSIITDITNQ